MMQQQVTTALKLPFQFDEKMLLKDLNLVLKKQWIPHFNTRNYEGKWTSIALYAKGGDATNIFAMLNDDASIMETPILKDCLYLKKVIQHFKCPFLSIRLLQLNVGAVIKPHRDYKLGYEDNNFRLHIPITTNPDVHFILNGERLQMLAGECWYTNVNYVHSVANQGQSDRVHLVIDGERNAWSDELFFALAPQESFFPIQKTTYDSKTLKKMIEALKYIDSPAATELIQTYEQQLKTTVSD